MTTWALVDLDDSLFRSKRRAEPGQLGEPATVDKTGEPYSYASLPQQTLFRLLQTVDRVIPVTARPTESFKRVTLPFKDIAICTMGASYLRPDGTPDPEWHAKTVVQLAPHQGELHRMSERLKSHEVRVRTVSERGCPIYISVRLFELTGPPLAALQATIGEHLPPGWRRYQHRDQITLLPPGISKRAAVQRLIEGERPDLLIGLGDTWADLGFLDLCDLALTPTSGQLFSALKRAPLAGF